MLNFKTKNKLKPLSKKKTKALVILSGGYDSGVCLAYAVSIFGPKNVYAISYDYNQRHKSELKAAKKLAAWFKIAEHKIVKLPFLAQFSQSALTNKKIKKVGRIEAKTKKINTLVIGRNALFVRVAALYANQVGATQVYIGITAPDLLHYSDCSRSYMKTLEKNLKIDLNNPHFYIETPLAKMNKVDIMTLAASFGPDVFETLWFKTVSCYEGISKNGEGCGKCPACHLREKGAQEFVENWKSIQG